MDKLNNDITLVDFEAWYVVNRSCLDGLGVIRVCDRVLDYVKEPWWKPGRHIRWRRVSPLLIEKINKKLEEAENK